ncbi:MAG: hypothetical protein MUO40_03175 [Anaerolineaceae bacterium]|nr:hypothetical protein [Anaerolineaceae bacterium]
MINKKPKILVVIVALVSIMMMSACAIVHASKAEETDNPEIIQDNVPENESMEHSSTADSQEDLLPMLSFEDARDIAIAYLLDKFELESPGLWDTFDNTPENLVGSSKKGFTSGAWSVFMSAPVVAPEYLVFSIEIDHLSSGLRWIGEVDAKGSLHEISLSEPLKVLSPADAGIAAVDFILEMYGWQSPDMWTEQTMQPIEKAGIRRTFTSGPWVVQVEYMAGAPIVPEYRVIVDNLNLVARWVGIVRADGEIVELEYLTE